MGKYRIWPYEEVYDYFKDQGCELKTPKEEYINTQQLLDFICSCGNHDRVRFTKFKNRGQRCKECGKKKLSKAISLTYEEVKIYVESLGFELIDKEYKNTTQKLTLKDNEGYYYSSRYSNLLTGFKPSRFHKQNPYTIQNIKLWCKYNNKPFELVSDTYIDAFKKMKWKCLKLECLDIFQANWSDIQTGNGCGVCKGLQVTLSNCLATKRPDLALEWHPFKNGNLTPFDVTCGYDKKVWWQCSKGHEWKSTVNHRNSGTGCPRCNNSKGEMKIDEILSTFDIPHGSQYTFKDLRGYKDKILKFDVSVFWDKEKTQLRGLIEYDGGQHFRQVEYFGGKKAFEALKKNDIKKNLYCAEHGIQLIRIPYWEFDNIEKYLKYYLID